MQTSFETQVLRELEGVRQQIDMLTKYIFFHMDPKLNHLLAAAERCEDEEGAREREEESVLEESFFEAECDKEHELEEERAEKKKREARIKKEKRRLAILQAMEWGRQDSQRLKEARKGEIFLVFVRLKWMAL